MPHFCIFFYQTMMRVFFEEIIAVSFLNHICRGNKRANSLLIWNRSINDDKQQASKLIYLHFVCKRRIGRRRNVVLIHFVYVKPHLKFFLCLCSVWIFLYFVYDNMSILCMAYFDYLFSILCMTLSLTSTFSIYYIIHSYSSVLKKSLS